MIQPVNNIILSYFTEKDRKRWIMIQKAIIQQRTVEIIYPCLKISAGYLAAQ